MNDSSQPKNSYETLVINEKTIEELLKDCTIDLSGTGVESSDITITSIDSSRYYDTNTLASVTLTPTYTSIGSGVSTFTIGSGTVSIDSIDTSSFAFNLPKEWVDTFPMWTRVQDMCEKYPGLKVAFDNFKVFYEMVKDDYDNPTPKK